MIGGGEILLILFAVLMLFGANSIPDIAKTLGKTVREFNKATEEIKKEFNDATSDIRNDINDVTNTVKDEARKVKDEADSFNDSTK